jgi:excisionase family DNA binding protein
MNFTSHPQKTYAVNLAAFPALCNLVHMRYQQCIGGNAMEVLSTSQAVREFGVHPITVSRLILTGRLEAVKDPDGHWRISRSSLERWDRQRVRRVPKQEHAAMAGAVSA